MLIASNAFFSSYGQSDLLGKSIFISLFLLSITTWTLFIYKWRETKQAEEQSRKLWSRLKSHLHHPLSVETNNEQRGSPFLSIYSALKRHAIEVLNKNKNFISDEHRSPLLSSSDIQLVAGHLETAIAQQSKKLEKNLYILSTTVSLAPFLGLLGTVWGILLTFSQLQSHVAQSNETVLSGISMALATTVLGLVVAIPALIAYSYLRHRMRSFHSEMVIFSNEILSAVEMRYRKVDVD
jgi:biopolymer transport protein TolQ